MQFPEGLFLRRTDWERVDFECANDSVRVYYYLCMPNNLYDEKILELVLLTRACSKYFFRRLIVKRNTLNGIVFTQCIFAQLIKYRNECYRQTLKLHRCTFFI